MLKFDKYSTPIKKTIFTLRPGEIFETGGKKFSFERIKRGNKSMVGKDIINGSSYTIKIHDLDTEYRVIGTEIIVEEEQQARSLKDFKKGELVVIMKGQGDKTPQLYRVEEIKPSLKYDYILGNPFTGDKWKFSSSDSWVVYSLDDIK